MSESIEKIKFSAIKDVYKGGLLKLLEIATWKRTWFVKSYCIIALSFSLIVTCLSFCSETLQIEIIKNILDLTLPFFGALIGFSLSGFILVATLGDSGLIKRSTDNQIKNLMNGNTRPYSYIQVVISKYAFIVILQFGILLILLFAYFVLSIKLSSSNEKLVYLTNSFFLFLIVFLTVYGTLLTFSLITNIFTISQSRNFSFLIDELEDREQLDRKG